MTRATPNFSFDKMSQWEYLLSNSDWLPIQNHGPILLHAVIPKIGLADRFHTGFYLTNSWGMSDDKLDKIACVNELLLFRKHV